jgi:multidrug efflux system membrane fusion protein
VHASDPNGLVVLAQLDPISVIFTLPQEQLSRISAQQGRAPLAVEAWSRDSTEPLARGELAVIDNQVSPTTATLKLKAVVQNREHALWPNQFVKARLLVSVKRGALVVPVEAVLRGAKGSYVYVVGADATARPRDVEVESVEGPLALISGGLKLNEQVVIDGQSQLKPGAKVKAQERKKPAGPAPQVGS